jgi:hypothetical protein
MHVLSEVEFLIKMCHEVVYHLYGIPAARAAGLRSSPRLVAQSHIATSAPEDYGLYTSYYDFLYYLCVMIEHQIFFPPAV